MRKITALVDMEFVLEIADIVRKDLIYIAQITLAAILGAIVGWERESKDREAGIRTYAVVSLAACAFSLVSIDAATGHGDPGRIASQILPGMGFLGAGVILVHKGRITGLTTAATLWSSASIGMAVGYGMYAMALALALLMYFILAIKHWPLWMKVTPSEGSQDKKADDPDDKDASHNAHRPKVIKDGEYHPK